MSKMRLMKILVLLLIVCFVQAAVALAQDPPVSSSEYSEDGVPVLIKNLPEPDEVRAKAVWAKSVADIESVIGKQSVLDLVELVPGVEAAVAVYPEGKLLLIEYPTPQFSTDADQRFQARLAELGQASTLTYRKIGNYSAFVFDSQDPQSANKLLDQIKYSKTVQWLGEDPNYQKKVERYFAGTTADIFISTLIAIVVGAGIAAGLGVVVGLLFYKYEEKRRHSRHAFSDAGGMTRLNLDELSGD